MKSKRQLQHLQKSGLTSHSRTQTLPEEDLLHENDFDDEDIQVMGRQPMRLKYHAARTRPQLEHSPHHFNTQTRVIHNKSPKIISQNFTKDKKIGPFAKAAKSQKYHLSERDFYSILKNSDDEFPQKTGANEEAIHKTFVRQKSRSRSFLKNEKSKSRGKEKINMAEKINKLKILTSNKNPRQTTPTKSQNRSKSNLKLQIGHNKKIVSKSPNRKTENAPKTNNSQNNNPAQQIPTAKSNNQQNTRDQHPVSKSPTKLLKQTLKSDLPSEEHNLATSNSQHGLFRSNSINRVRSSQVSNRSLVKRKIKQFDTDLTFRPMLSKKSLQIAERLGKSVDRLTKNLYRQKDSDEETEDPRKLAQPKINKVSKQIDNKNKGQVSVKNRFERLYQYSRIYKQTNEDQRIKRIEEDLQKELIINRLPTPDRRKTPKKDANEHFFTSEVDVSERNNLWQTKIKEKLDRLKGQQSEVELRGCTFRPQMEVSQTSFQRQSSRNLKKTSEFMKEGLTDHFTRVEMAKQKKSYLEINRQRSPSVGNFRGNEKEEPPVQARDKFHQFAQKWSNTQKNTFEPEDPEKQKVSTMLENLKKMM